MIKTVAKTEPSTLKETNQSSIELIKFGENQKFYYFGYCKIQINLLSKVLCVNATNKNFNNSVDHKAPFKWKFIRQKKIIFVFGEFNYQDFALIFNDCKKCLKAYNGIFKNRKKDFVTRRLLHKRFLIPIFKSINNTNCARMKAMMKEWIQKHDKHDRKELLQLLSEHGNNDILQEIENSNQCKRENNRKRKLLERDNNSFCEQEKLEDGQCYVKETSDFEKVLRKKTKRNNSTKVITKIIDESYFKIVKTQNQKVCYRKVLIFTTPDKTFCYEYHYYPNKQLLYHKCRNGLTPYKAILEKDENGNEYIKMKNAPHQCTPLKYDPKIYMELKIIRKPDYKLFENGTKRTLIIFDKNDNNQCYEYFWSSDISKFVCCECKKVRKRINAEICNEGTDGEYIRLLNDKHVCKMKKVNPEKLNETKQFILTPNFEIQMKTKNEKKIKVLIIFDKNNRNLCYIYYYSTPVDTFYCNGCKFKEKNVSAKLCQNSDGIEYVILSNAQHICSLKTYIPQNNEIILRPPNVKFIERTIKNSSKLLIFDSNNPALCYTFSEKQNFYYCLGCAKELKDRSTKKTAIKNTNFIAYLFKEKDNSNNEEYYVKINSNHKHICKPKKYEPEKYVLAILKPNCDYFLFRQNGTDATYLAIYFLNNQKNLCYKYFYNKQEKSFVCWGCHKQKCYITAKIQQDSEGNEYITINKKEHICTPLKVSSIKADAAILEKCDLPSSDKQPKKKKEKIDEKRIIRFPRYKFEKGKDGNPEKNLFIFTSDDQNLCYEYRYVKTNYICKKCRAPAKLYENDTEKYIILGKREHECEPIKYEAAENKIITAPNFMIFNRDNEKKLTKLIIFTSPTKEKCYEYTFNKQRQSFQCGACDTLKKKVCAKLMKDNDDENGEEYIQILKNEHICAPKKFILEIFQPKIICNSRFKIFSNQNGKPESKLIVFDTEKKGYGYEYTLENNKLFLCRFCKKMKKRVTAKLMENEINEKYLELSPDEHVCKSIKCNC